MQSQGSTPRLAPATMVAYGLPAIMLAAMSIAFYIYLPKYYVDEFGIDLGALGVIILASRLWDAITDPAIGALSDRTRSRFGRRRPWMLLAAIPLAGTFFLLTGPQIIGITESTIVALSFLFFLSWTAVTIPYESLGPEISFDYDERNRLFGVREGCVLIGTVVAAAIPAALPPGSYSFDGYGAVGVFFGVVLVASIVVCVWLVRERDWGEKKKPRGSPWNSVKAVFGNLPFSILIGAYTIYALGGAVAATIFLFFVEHVLESGGGPLFLALYLGSGVVFLPAWIWLSRRWEKKGTWIVCLALTSGTFGWVALLGPGDEVLFAILVGIAGIGVGGAIAIPPSMQADTIDLDELRTGIRREGQYVGMWALAKKLAMALGAGLAFPILSMAGYTSGLDVQPETTRLALRWLYVGVPVVCNLLAVGLVLAYPITRKVHRHIASRLQEQPPTLPV